MNKRSGIISSIVSACAFGLTPLLCNLAYEAGATPTTLVFLRNLFVIPILYLVIKFRGIDIKVDKQTLFKIFLVAVFGMTATALLLYNAYNYLPSGSVTTLHFLYPVFVSFIGIIFFKEHVSRNKGLILTIATCGIFFFMETGTELETHKLILGIVLSVSSALSYAFYLVGIERFDLKRLNAYTFTFYLSLCSEIIVTIGGLLHGSLVFSNLSPITYLYGFIISMVASMLGISALFNGIKHIGATSAAIYSLFEPVVAVIAGVLLLQERLSLMRAIGCIVILGSVLIISKMSHSHVKY